MLKKILCILAVLLLIVPTVLAEEESPRLIEAQEGQAAAMQIRSLETDQAVGILGVESEPVERRWADFSAVFKDFILTDENAPEKPAPCDHKQSVSKPSCSAPAVCSICGKTIPATGHADNNGDGKCDKCGAVTGTVCNHICHSENGFLKFIWNIAKFFCRLFGINRYCDCGAAHY